MASLKSGGAVRTIGCLFEQGTCLGASDAQLLEWFVAGRNEAAFEALVVRHGRSVLAACRDVLRDPHDAEDAFQATFLILARKAGTLWVRDSLAAWLHRVARRVAVEANRRKARRRVIETTGLEIDDLPSEAREPREMLGQFLHEEIDRLPEKYRAPIILCDLEGLTRDEAAGQLGWPPGTVAGRLARARALLRDRLARRGHLAAGGLLVAGARRLWPDAVPASWIGKTVQLVILSHTGPTGTTMLASAAVWVLARGVLNAMTLTSLRRMALLLVVGALATTAGALVVATASPQSPPAGASTTSARRPTDRTSLEAVTDRAGGAAAKFPVSGTLLLPDGKPAGEVRVFYSTRDHLDDYGHIRVETRADAAGRFSLELPPVDGAWPGMVGTGTLWVYRPESLVATTPVYRGALPPGSHLRLAVGPTAGALFEVHGPDGKPVAGARVQPRMLDRNLALVPDRLAELIGAESVTDARGRAVMAAFSQEEIRRIEIVSEVYGRQDFHFGFREITPDPKIIRLRPVGRLKGRLVGDREAIRRCPLNVLVSGPPGGEPRFGSMHHIATDDEGRFEIPTTPVGPHTVRITPRSDFPWYGQSVGSGDVEPGQTTELVIPLKRAVRVRGLVRERGTSKPIAGVRLAVAIEDIVGMTSGKDGTYEGFAPPEASVTELWYVPPSYACPLYGTLQSSIPEGVVEYVMPPIELIRAGAVLGKVVGDQARPAVGAEVDASWNFDESGPGTGSHHLKVRTGPDGRFVIPGVPQGSKVSLQACHRGMRTPEPRSTGPGEAVILHLTLSSGVSLAGQVLDPGGRPAVGASVHLRHRRPGLAVGAGLDDERVEFQSGSCLIPDAEGRFRTPQELDVKDEYAAIASAPGFLTSRTPWIFGHSGSFPVIRLRPVP